MTHNRDSESSKVTAVGQKQVKNVKKSFVFNFFNGPLFFQRPAIFLDQKLTSYRTLNRCPISLNLDMNAIPAHETLDISLSSVTSAGTFACSAGP